MSQEKRFTHHFDKAVGVPTALKDRQEIFERNLAKFVESAKEKMGGELEKTEDDKDIIVFADNAVTDSVKKYGRAEGMRVALENIHLLEEGGVKKFTDGKLEGGAASPLFGDIVVDRGRSDLQFALVLFHELFHLKSYNALQVTTENKPSVYRGGFSVVSRDGKNIYFKDVEEAIVGYMERRFYYDILSREPRFQEEIEQLLKEGREPEFGRMAEQRMGMELIDKLFELSKDKFQSKDEIIEMFVEAQVTGNLLKIGRLIEQAMGKGSFRRLGEKTAQSK